MDKRLLFALPGLLILIVVAIAVWFVIHTKSPTPTPVTVTTQNASSTDLSGSAIYTNGSYGLYLVYPQSATVEDTFKTYYHLSSTWRANALADATGTPIVAIVTYRVEHDHSYPRYFDAEVRVGASSDRKEIQVCEKAGNGEVVLPDIAIGSTVFKTFSFSQAGMMQYLKGVSYRTIHDGKCYAIEKIETGSSYRDDPASSEDVPDATLDAAFAHLDDIVKSFGFAR